MNNVRTVSTKMADTQCMKCLFRCALILALLPGGWVRAQSSALASDAYLQSSGSIQPASTADTSSTSRNVLHTDGQAIKSNPAKTSTAMSVKKVFTNLPGDQAGIWSAPFRIRATDIPWLLPVTGAAGALLASDERNMRLERSNPSAISLSNSISNAGTIGLAGVPGLMSPWGS